MFAPDSSFQREGEKKKCSQPKLNSINTPRSIKKKKKNPHNSPKLFVQSCRSPVYWTLEYILVLVLS